MRTIGGALAVDIVFVEDDIAGRRPGRVAVGGVHGAPGHHLPGTVPHQGVAWGEGLRRGVFGVGVIDIEPRPIGKAKGELVDVKPAISADDIHVEILRPFFLFGSK